MNEPQKNWEKLMKEETSAITTINELIRQNTAREDS